MSKKSKKDKDVAGGLLDSIDKRLGDLVAETQATCEQIRELRDDIKKIMETLTERIEGRG